jgi:hypothetical protein
MHLFASLLLVIDSTGTSDSCILIRRPHEQCGRRRTTLNGTIEQNLSRWLSDMRTALSG